MKVFIKMNAPSCQDPNRILTDFHQPLVEAELLGHLKEFCIKIRKECPEAKIDKGFRELASIKKDQDLSDIDQLNILIKILTNNHHFINSNFENIDIDNQDWSNNDLTQSIKKLLDFIQLFQTLFQTYEKKGDRDTKTVLIIASLEFFNYMHHLCIFFENTQDSKIQELNLDRANGHIKRAIRDIQKLHSYIHSELTLEAFRQRVQEIKNTGLED